MTLPVFDVFVAYRHKQFPGSHLEGRLHPPVIARDVRAPSAQHAAIYYCAPEMQDASLGTTDSAAHLIVVTAAGSAEVFDRDAIIPLEAQAEQMRIEREEREEYRRLKAKYGHECDTETAAVSD